MEVIVKDVLEDVSICKDINVSENDQIFVNGVVGSEFLIGFFGVVYYVENIDKLKVVVIVNFKMNEVVFFELDKIESGEYVLFS